MVCLTDLVNGVMIILPSGGIKSISPIAGVTGSMVSTDNGRNFYVKESIKIILKKIEKLT